MATESPPAPPGRPGAPTRAEQVAAARKLGGGVGRGPVGRFFRAIGRALSLGLANLVFPRPRASLPPPEAIHKVLVIRVDERVGNQLLTTPLLRALKLGLPAAELHLLAPRQGHLVLSPHVDRAIPWQKREAFTAPLRFLGLLRDLRRARYDLVVEAGHWSAFSLTASLLARLVAGRAPVVGHDRGDSARFLSHPVAHDPAVENEVPAKLELLRPLGLPDRGLELDTGLGLGPPADEAARLLAGAGLLGKALAVVNPGARFADRRWPPENHAAVCRGLAARGLAPLVVWGPGEEPLARAIAEGSGAALAPPTSLPVLAALMRRARLVVSNNSGPMHLGVAVRTPTVGVFFRGDSARWGHRLATFAAAEVRGEEGAEVVLRACGKVMGG